jgi:hypothetical protein
VLPTWIFSPVFFNSFYLLLASQCHNDVPRFIWR